VRPDFVTDGGTLEALCALTRDADEAERGRDLGLPSFNILAGWRGK
jgi:hypothetical protein